jgi:hypothetical protein
LFSIRASILDDEVGILHAHYSAVHETAKRNYSEGILNAWSRPVDAQRVAAYRAWKASDKSIVSFVATLESKAKKIGMEVFRMESSLTAVPFYLKHGFRELSRGEHRLVGGLMMACVNMEKSLEG